MGVHQIVHFFLSGPIHSDQIRTLRLPPLDRSRPVILSGRGPIWLYGYLLHQCHPHPWVAVYDPRLAGAVVVECHMAGGPGVGSVIPVPDEIRKVVDS